jgi:hypothetical protein
VLMIKVYPGIVQRRVSEAMPRVAGLLFPHCLLICTGLSQAQLRVFI